MRTKGLPLAVTFLLLIMLGACGGGAAFHESGTRDNGIAQDTPTPVDTAPATSGPVSGLEGWPAFPGDNASGRTSPVRRTSGSAAFYGTGWAQQGGVNNYADTLVPDSYVIAPDGVNNLLAWAWYTVPDLDTERPVSVDFCITPAPLIPGGASNLPLSYWVGVCNYTRAIWQWYGPYITPGLTSITLNNQAQDVLDRYVSSDTAHNTFHIIVATDAEKDFITAQNPRGLTAARIETLTVHTLDVSDPDYAATRPHYAVIQSIGAPGGKGSSALDPVTQYVEIHWLHLSDPYDTDLEATQYRLYRQGPMDTDRICIGSVGAPVEVYADPTDNSTGTAEVVPGATYKYWLCAFNAQGHTPFSQNQATIPLLAPANVQASDAMYEDNVVLTWTKAEGASGYKIYRDGQTEAQLLATVGDVSTYQDSDLPDYNGHMYWLRSVNQYVPNGGQWSIPDAGFKGIGGADDTLYAIPSVSQAAVGSPVRITVMTGATAHPFLFANLISVTVETGADYVTNSFNAGELGGDKEAIDGLWTSLSPSSLLLPVDPMFWEEEIGGGRKRIEFMVAAIDGTELSGAKGRLLNFELVFNAPGTYTLGFQQADGVRSRTYYSEANETPHFWGDITNEHPGIPNSITVQ